MADTGPIVDGTAFIQVVGTSTVLLACDIQHRNANNDGNINEFAFKVPPNTSWDVYLGAVSIASGERVRVVTDGILVGTAQVLISRT